MRNALLVLLGCGLCWGQAPDECKPSSLNIPGAPYPCVHAGSAGDLPRRGAGRAESAGSVGRRLTI